MGAQSYDIAELLWTRVNLVRRAWTYLSVTVMSLASWLLVGLGCGADSPLFWPLSLLSLGAAGMWLVAWRAHSHLQRRLKALDVVDLAAYGSPSDPRGWSGSRPLPARPGV